MENYYEKKIEIHATESDYTGSWHPGDVFRALQNIAEYHAAELGAGFDVLRARNIAWILTRLELVMKRYPKMHEIITLATWPLDVKHSVYPRCFQMTDKEGNILGYAYSMWVLMDITTRTMLSAEHTGVNPPGHSAHTIPLKLCKNIKIDKSITPITTIRPLTYTDIDINMHVNNTHYIDWLCEAFPIEKHEKEQIGRILINYNNEIHVGLDKVTLDLRQSGSSFTFCDEISEKPHFAIEGEWVPRE